MRQAGMGLGIGPGHKQSQTLEPHTSGAPERLATTHGAKADPPYPGRAETHRCPGTEPTLTAVPWPKLLIFPGSRAHT